MAKKRIQDSRRASEFYVASQLSRLGYIVTLTSGQTKKIDLIVTHPDGRKITIDVKGLKNKTNWPIQLKYIREDHFFILVSYLSKFEYLSLSPEIFVIPSMQMKSLLGNWSGKPMVEAIGYSTVRNSKFKDAWNLLFA